jgi:hypothetical protein
MGTIKDQREMGTVCLESVFSFIPDFGDICERLEGEGSLRHEFP